MKKKNLFGLVCLLALGATDARAQKAGDFGAGVIVGGPTAITGKLWLSGTQAADLGVGWYSRPTVYGDYLWHGWNILPQPSKGKMPLYLGLGAQVRAFSDAEFGIRTVAGLAYWLPEQPIEIFIEAVPIFYVTRYPGVGLDGGLGLRYYFSK